MCVRQEQNNGATTSSTLSLVPAPGQGPGQGPGPGPGPGSELSSSSALSSAPPSSSSAPPSSSSSAPPSSSSLPPSFSSLSGCGWGLDPLFQSQLGSLCREGKATHIIILFTYLTRSHDTSFRHHRTMHPLDTPSHYTHSIYSQRSSPLFLSPPPPSPLLPHSTGMWSALEEAFSVMDGHTREVETALAAFRHTLAPLYKA